MASAPGELSRTDSCRLGCQWGAPRANLAVVYPAVTAIWHPALNDGLRPEDVRPRSNKVMWWLCPDCEKPFLGAVVDRVVARHCCCGACARFRSWSARRA
ncbi:zinc-ribbon domain-containing protein [Streptomyces sp. NBC_01077]|uniref:zinc-ribbon domain-containing protein n=1 Tax=Streptomyces sp. NBC_01077 TaxID=2903746 RepID=UPI00386795DC